MVLAMFCAFFSVFLYESICYGYSFDLHRQVDAIQMGTHNICLYKVDKRYTVYNLNTTELLDCALKGVCAVIRLNMVYYTHYLECTTTADTKGIQTSCWETLFWKFTGWILALHEPSLWVPRGFVSLGFETFKNEGYSWSHVTYYLYPFSWLCF